MEYTERLVTVCADCTASVDNLLCLFYQLLPTHWKSEATIEIIIINSRCPL